MAKKGIKLTEEHKRKISEAHKGKTISMEQRKKISETLKEKGIKPKEIFYAKREEHPLWKGGRGNIIARKICQDNGRDLTTCQICKDKGKMIVHHCDGNINNNNNFNLGIVCSFCHFAIHDNPNKQATRFKEGHLPYSHQLIEVTPQC